MTKTKTTDHAEIANKLSAYLGLNLGADEVLSAAGFKKIADAIIAKQCNNADIDFLNIDLNAFEQLARNKGCFEIIFSPISPVIDNFLSGKPHDAANQYNPNDFLPDDHCGREQPAYQ